VFRSTRVRLGDGRIALIRRARPRDAKAVISHVNAVGAERVYLMTERLNVTLKEEKAILRRADGESRLYLVAIVDGKIGGTADFSRGRQSNNRHVASCGIALRRDVRGLGLGKAMMRAGLSWARSVGIRKVTLGVFATNRNARALYRTLGFVREGQLRGQVMLDRKPVDELLLAVWL